MFVPKAELTDLIEQCRNAPIKDKNIELFLNLVDSTSESFINTSNSFIFAVQSSVHSSSLKHKRREKQPQPEKETKETISTETTTSIPKNIPKKGPGKIVHKKIKTTIGNPSKNRMLKHKK